MKKDPLLKALLIFALIIVVFSVSYLIYVAVTISAISAGTAIATQSFGVFSYIVLSANALLILLTILYIPFRKV